MYAVPEDSVEIDQLPLSRRRFTARAASLLSSCLVATGCLRRGDGQREHGATLRARPLATRTTWDAGTRALGLGRRDATVYLPPNDRNEPLPLLVLLHGAGGSGARILNRLLPIAGSPQVAMLAPDSRGSTWDAVSPQSDSLLDVIVGDTRLAGFGPDVAFLDTSLTRVFESIAVHPARIAIGGFSDGATYALSLGLTNGALFKRIVAFSPGFIAGGIPDEREERPSVFISHGRADTILPIDRTSLRIVPDLRARGYEVTFREFEGGHDIPEAIAREALAWLETLQP
jgi:predicted esterase